jgi:hypothetical protein
VTALDELHASGRKWQVVWRNGWVARMFESKPRADGSVHFAHITPPHRTYADAVTDLVDQWALAEAADELDTTMDRLRQVIRDVIEAPATMAVRR